MLRSAYFFFLFAPQVQQPVQNVFLVIILLVIFLCFYPEKEGSGIPEIAGSGPGERHNRGKRKASDLNELIQSSSSESPMSLRPHYHLPGSDRGGLRRMSDSLKNLDLAQSDSGLESGYPTLRKGSY